MKWEIEPTTFVTELDLNSSILAEKKPINRFVLGSTFLHILSASAVVMLSQIPEPQKDIVEIEFHSAPIAKVQSTPLPAPVLQAPAPLPQKTAPVQTLAKAPPTKAVPKVAQTATVAPSAPAPVAVVKEISSPEPVATLDDIETPTLDDSEVATVIETEAQQPKVTQQEIKEKLNQKEKLHAEKAALLAAQLEQDTSAAHQDAAQALDSASADVENQNALEAQEAAEKATALQQEAAEKAALMAAQKTAPVAGPGAKGELRALDQLRQMPGNPRPQYEAQERFKGHNGNVIFKAFVTNEGRLKNFEMIQSTGFKNLDFKTLKALKQWRFYPGQEGWVELPFRWDLKGGPQEMPTLLRRKVGQN